jgi:hypothetical protein
MVLSLIETEGDIGLLLAGLIYSFGLTTHEQSLGPELFEEMRRCSQHLLEIEVAGNATVRFELWHFYFWNFHNQIANFNPACPEPVEGSSIATICPAKE